MFLMDVNVLVYAHREDTPDHLTYREWLESVINGDAAGCRPICDSQHQNSLIFF